MHISDKNHDTQTDKGNINCKVLTLHSFSNMVDREATKVLCNYLLKCLPGKDILLEPHSHS